MSKFNLSRQNLIIGVASLSILALIITFFIVNSSNSQKLSSPTNNSSSSIQNSNSNFSNANSAVNSSQIFTSSNLQSSNLNITNSSNSIISQASANLSTNSQAQNSANNIVNPVNINSQNNSKIEEVKPQEKLTQNENNKKVETYINPSYPNLKINYDKSWKIERESLPFSDSKELFKGKITLIKNDSRLEFQLEPSIPVGCDPLHDEKVYSLNSKIERVYSFDVDPIDHSKIIETTPNQYYYRKVGTNNDGCYGVASLKLKTNITYNNLSDKDKAFNSPKRDLLVKDGALYYVAYISLNSSKSNEIAQADEIIKNSVLE